jgi:methyltransferase (TIGR00027 family)
MEEGRPSLTAVVAAMMRAAHLLLDNEPKILRDDLALRLSGVENEAALRVALEGLQAEIAQRTTPEFAHSLFRYLRAFITWRSRYVEDALETALQRGVAQYVILGAGLDSFAYRRRDRAGGLRVFEVDQPATQQWKCARLHALGVELPPNLTFVPIDFENQTLREGLRAGGYRLGEPGVFSWLGVIQYLTEDAIFSTLRDVAALAPGTEIIFEYEILDSLLDAESQYMVAVLKAGAASRGEPWLSFFDPASLMARLRELGFTEVWDLGSEDANTRYFTDRTDGLRLPVPSAGNLMRARVGSAT